MSKKKQSASKCNQNELVNSKWVAKNQTKPCYRMNITNTSAILDILNTSGNPCDSDSTPLSISSNIKNYTKYDDGIEHSKELHFKSCKAHQKKLFRSFKKRKFVSTNREDFETLIGKGELFADHMPASDLKLRNATGKLLLNELHELFERSEVDPSINLIWMTFVEDRFMFNERGGPPRSTSSNRRCRRQFGTTRLFPQLV